MVMDSWSYASMAYVGFNGEVEACDMPMVDAEWDETEEQELLRAHYRLFVSHLREILLFAILHMSPPWEWIRYMESPRCRPMVLAKMRAFWEMVHCLESSDEAILKGFSQQLNFKDRFKVDGSSTIVCSVALMFDPGANGFTNWLVLVHLAIVCLMADLLERMSRMVT